MPDRKALNAIYIEKFRSIADDIAEGLGVEDIAVQRDLEPTFVRKVVDLWRRSGTLPSIIRDGRMALNR